jgi:hypothetical protein
MRSFAQIPARIKYFIGILDFPGGSGSGVVFDYDETIQLPTYPGPILTLAEFQTKYTGIYLYPGVSTGELLKDMGQQFIITDDAFNHRAIYRRVQRVRGVDSEGVGGDPTTGWNTFYVKVWDADDAAVSVPSKPVVVARTG